MFYSQIISNTEKDMKTNRTTNYYIKNSFVKLYSFRLGQWYDFQRFSYF